MPATPPLPPDPAECARLAQIVGYPVMLKASWGGGGRGMRVIESDAQLAELLPVARREAKAAFGNDEVYLEKLVRRARHLEVQILGDSHGNLVHLFERDCTVQRRNQKVVERAPAVFLSDEQRAALCEAALKIGRAASYCNAGTVEFLQDADSGKFYFIEVNPRIQVEHTVTECATGIDLVKAQIRIADGARIGDPASGVPAQAQMRLMSHALQCRVTTEDPFNNFVPDYGRMTAYRSPAGFGVRLDAGTAYAGALITRSYDSLLVKVTTWAQTPEETIARMHRALWEFRIRGVATNLRFLDQIITHPRFAQGQYTTRFIDETPELFAMPRRRDRATRILSFLAETVVNGNPEVAGRARPERLDDRRDRHGCRPACAFLTACRPGTKQRFDQLGPARFAQWMREQQRVLLTDTTMRDAHQSLLATRMRTIDMAAIAPAYAALLPRAVLGGMLGRRDLRRRDAISQGGSVGAAGAAARGDAEPAAADAAALGQCGRLHQLSRQRGALLRAAVGRGRHRRVPRLRLAQLGREHAGGDRRGARERQAVRGGDLLHRQPEQPARAQVHARLLPQAGARAEGRRHPRSRHQGHGGPVPAAGGLRSGQGAAGTRPICRCTSIPTTPAASRRPVCSRRSPPARMRSMRRWIR